MDFDLHADDAQLLLIDIQERFAGAIPSIADGQPVGRALAVLAAGCALLRVPTIISEQVPEKLGPTLVHLRGAAGNAATTLPKASFSCGDDPTLLEAIAAAERPSVIVAGIETHVCVLATVDDLLRRGYRVAVAVDAVDSRDPSHRDHAIATLRQLGALCLPAESILFRMQREAGSGCFKELSKLVK